MERKPNVGEEVGVDLLLAGSDAFAHLAEELAAAQEHWREAGTEQVTLDWFGRMAAFAGWWCGRLEAEADYAAGFGAPSDAGSPAPGATVHPTNPCVARAPGERRSRWRGCH